MNRKVFFDLQVLLFVLIVMFFTQSCNRNKEPVCSITYPSNGQTLYPGDLVTMTFDANDEDGVINEVRILLNGVGIGSSIYYPYEFIWDTKDIALGNYTLKIIAEDSEGALGEDEIQINFQTLNVTTNQVSSISGNSAVGGGEIVSDGGIWVSKKGVCWSTSANPNLEDEHSNEGAGSEQYISNIDNLTFTTQYFVRAYAINEIDTAYGEQISFTTLDICGDLNNISYNGQTYEVGIIGEQCWFLENLNVGSRIDGNQEQTDNGIIEKYCYNDDVALCDEYGGLYQWNELMKYTTTEDKQGICPEGWHAPTFDDWFQIQDFLGDYSTAGGKMKESGTIHWNYPNTGATNSSGFTGLPGGSTIEGYSINMGEEALFWTSDPYNNRAEVMKLYYNNPSFYWEFSYNTNRGLSVRCIKD